MLAHPVNPKAASSSNDNYLQLLRRKLTNTSLRSKSRRPVAIYRPGQRPAGADEGGGSSNAGSRARAKTSKSTLTANAAKVIRRSNASLPPADGSQQQQRPAFSKAIVLKSERKQRIAAAAAGSDDDEETAIERRRQNAVKEEQQAESEQQAATESSSGSDDEDDDSSDESEEDEDELHTRLQRPVFRSRAQREALAATATDSNDYQQLASAEDKAAELAEQRAEELRLQSKQYVLDAITSGEEQKSANVDTEAEELPDDTDYPADEEYELDLWKLRELTRLRRERAERQQVDAEKQEVERRRHLTDSQLLEDNRKLGLRSAEEVRAEEQEKRRDQRQFLQRYHHKGGFTAYQDEELLASRDIHAPTGVDNLTNYDTTLLPQALQIKQDKIGIKGRTKYKHLGAEDTSRRRDDDWQQRYRRNDHDSHQRRNER